MNYIIKNKEVSFSSKKVPIAPFEIETSNGKLYVQELRSVHDLSKQELSEASKILLNNFMYGSDEPAWKKFRSSSKLKYKNSVVKYNKFIKKLFNNDDGSMTILLAKDEKGQLQAEAIAMHYNEIKGFHDKQTLFIDSLAVNESYRKNGVATTLMKKILETTQGFTDAILTGYNRAVPLYSDLGFNITEADNEIKLSVIKKIIGERKDIPKYTQLMDMVLDENSTRWWERLAKKIR